MDFLHVVFVEAPRTADYQMTTGLRQIVENSGNEDDIIAFLTDKNLPVDSIEARKRPEMTPFPAMECLVRLKVSYNKGVISRHCR